VIAPKLQIRRGFTLLEMVLSLSLMLMVIGLTTQMFRKQGTAVATQSGLLDAQQNSRFASSMLERELRVAGVGVVDQQPLLVMANKLALTFNADLVSLDTGDMGSVYINPDVDSSATDVLRTNEAITLPTTATTYPETTYMSSPGVPSNAETISYWLSHDSTSSFSNEYVLFRRANARPARVVARGIIYNTGDTIFHYFKSDTLGNLTEVAPSALPLIHTAPIHGTTADTGKSALTDSIREVRITFTSVFHDPRKTTPTLRTQRATIHLLNAGLLHHVTCGQPPIAPTSVIATVTAANGTTVPQTYTTVSWVKSVDDGAGEKDIIRYALYRRLSSVSTFDEPFASVPAGAASYSFNDFDVQSGQTWVYAVAAVDCSPATSSTAQSSSIAIP
jgi:prepilin-type N-terminal cleavage/methylation domain-containing protein